MPRVTKALAAKAKHKKVLKATKGHYGARSRLFRTAKQSNVKALQYAFRDRRNKKRTFRSLWISRISAALIPLEVSYSRFINQLSTANIKLDRKSLAGIAFSDPDTFKKIVEKVRV
jgi:large subunit ribosomal protein L20